MAKPTAADISRAYAEVVETFSPSTTEMIVRAIADAPCGDLVTKDHLDIRLASFDQRFSDIDRHFIEIDKRFAEIDKRFVQIDERFADIDQRFNTVDLRFARLEAAMKLGFARIDARFVQSDLRHERSMRNFAISMMAAMFTFNGALAAWLTMIH